MEIFWLIVGYALIVSGGFGHLNKALSMRFSESYTLKDVKNIKPIWYNSIVGLIGIWLVGPSIIAASLFMSLFLFSFLFAFGIKEKSK